ncbi:cysteine desulfurase family protein [Geodermatophilus sp. SYSU D01106]
MTQYIYLDAAANTPIAPKVYDAMTRVLRDVVGNASSGNWAGRKSAELVGVAREQVAALTGGRHQVVFTSGATEANNLAITGLLSGPRGLRNQVVACRTEHPAVLNPINALSERGYKVQLLDVNEYGEPDLQQLAEVIGDRTALVSIMAANNETGTRADLSHICRLAHDSGALVHTDASQVFAFGSSPGVAAADLVTVSGQKMHAPQGVGALLVSPEVRRQLRPLVLGGGQERGLRSGTENTAGVVALGVAAELALQGAAENEAHVSRLRKTLIDSLEASLPTVEVNGHPTGSLPSIVNVSFGAEDAEVPADAVIGHMEYVAASSGSACSFGVPGVSHVLSAMGLPDHRAESAVRFGLSRLTTREELAAAVPRIISAVQSVRRLTDPGSRPGTDAPVRYR